MLPNWIVLDGLLLSWLNEDIGRGDLTTQGLANLAVGQGKAYWVAKEDGIVAGLPIAERVFSLLGRGLDGGIEGGVYFHSEVAEGDRITTGTKIAAIECPLHILLTGERVALNLAMRLSGIATMTSRFASQIADLPAQLVDTRKTTPGLRILEKYAAYMGGAQNHRMGLDDGVMIKDNHIAAAGGIGRAIAQIRSRIPYPITIEVETENLEQVAEAIAHQADIIMLDNMSLALMSEAVKQIKAANQRIKIEASGNITLERIRAVAETGVDYISTSAPITRSPWLDISMRIKAPS
ncbi:MAG: nicotinate-nucleotide pyrophosphorylase (carboxylating) NadC [Phormidesmis priestleyi Ana]|uniref:Probable nicotinate-nucleotide pyrophosphorylase [carboxylating] n=1 Tax=Phormidesmis priestleyi Ana TaxID=1666911 RepID=A0A0P8DGN5_9CYAN|nr:MAG: nicotinate-nucleotide pyrophosphorylase (carboxylating) NadC [Phormidesmis priestleyi Ana]